MHASADRYTPVGMRIPRSIAFCLFMAPLLATAADTTFVCADNGREIQQLRIYELNRSNRDAFHQRFQDHALRIMKKYDFRVLDIWESDTGEKLQFIYLLWWPDRETMDNSWKEFLADPEWIEIKKRSAAQFGELVRDAKGQSLERLTYSPGCNALPR